MTPPSPDKGLREAAQKVLDASTQDEAGRWIITGDGEWPHLKRVIAIAARQALSTSGIQQEGEER